MARWIWAGLTASLLAASCGGESSEADALAAGEAAKAAVEARREAEAAIRAELDGLQWEARAISVLPEEPRTSCNGVSAKLYNACISQVGILDEAIREAEHSGKVVVVAYGAEWCIWCHILYHHLDGAFGEFRYRLPGRGIVGMNEPLGNVSREEVVALNHFVADNVVLAYISDDADDGYSVLERTGADTSFPNALPFVYSLDRRGRAVRIMADEVAFRSSDGLFSKAFAGYDRKKLLAEFQSMARLGQAEAPGAGEGQTDASITAP